MDSLTDVVLLDVIPLVRAALKETARLSVALEALGHEVGQLTTELTEGELRETRRLLGTLLSQLGCPYERR